MITESIYKHIAELAHMLHNQSGWSVDRCEKFSAEINNLLVPCDKRAEQDRKDVAALRGLPNGISKITERFGCHKSTIYRRAKRGCKIVAASAT
jgi:hypothetical protein